MIPYWIQITNNALKILLKFTQVGNASADSKDGIESFCIEMPFHTQTPWPIFLNDDEKHKFAFPTITTFFWRKMNGSYFVDVKGRGK